MDDYLYEVHAEDYNVEIEKVNLDLTTVPDPEILKKAIKAAFKTTPFFERRSITYQGVEYPSTKVLWVSDLIFCARRKSYELISRSFSMTEESIVKTAIGNLAHKEIQRNMFAIAEFEKRFLKPYRNEYLLVGKVDCLLNNVIVDFKIVSRVRRNQVKKESINQERNQDRKEPTEQKKYDLEPDKYHIDQLQLYMWLTDTHFSYLVMINTYDGNVEVFLLKRDEKRIEELLNKGLKIIDSLAKLILPEPEPTYAWLCKSCIVENCEHRGKNAQDQKV